MEGRADGGPLTRSRAQAKLEKETELSEIEPNFDNKSAPVIEAVELTKNFELMNPVELFKHRF